MRYLIQSGGIMQKERRCVELNTLKHTSCPFHNLAEHKGDYVPVGSVEFTVEFARLNDILLPANISYPKNLLHFLKRKVWLDKFSNVNEDMFVKPLNTKVFTGAIKKTLKESVKPDEDVWVSNPLDIDAEFRYYVLDGKVVGQSRYDAGDNDIEPDDNVVLQIIKEYKGQPIGYSIDVGIVKGETILIEVNDGWSLGYYPWGNLKEKDYVNLITKRWTEICWNSHKLIELMRNQNDYH